jgi:hypothetical protein
LYELSHHTSSIWWCQCQQSLKHDHYPWKLSLHRWVICMKPILIRSCMPCCSWIINQTSVSTFLSVEIVATSLYKTSPSFGVLETHP